MAVKCSFLLYFHCKLKDFKFPPERKILYSERRAALVVCPVNLCLKKKRGIAIIPQRGTYVFIQFCRSAAFMELFTVGFQALVTQLSKLVIDDFGLNEAFEVLGYIQL